MRVRTSNLRKIIREELVRLYEAPADEEDDFLNLIGHETSFSTMSFEDALDTVSLPGKDRALNFAKLLDVCTKNIRDVLFTSYEHDEIAEIVDKNLTRSVGNAGGEESIALIRFYNTLLQEMLHADSLDHVNESVLTLIDNLTDEEHQHIRAKSRAAHLIFAIHHKHPEFTRKFAGHFFLWLGEEMYEDDEFLS